MPKPSMLVKVGDQYALPMQSAVRRINYALRQTTPYRELYYNRAEVNYFLRTIDPNHPNKDSRYFSMGPYYFKYLISLMDFINQDVKVWTLKELEMNPKVIQYHFNIIQQVNLPVNLRFDVCNISTQRMLNILEARGVGISTVFAEQRSKLIDGENK